MSLAAAVMAAVTADYLAALREAFDTGLSLEKCRACACMVGALTELDLELGQRPSLPLTEASRVWRQQIVPAQYECLGCDPCFAALAANALSGLAPLSGTAVFTQSAAPASRGDRWPPIPGEYYVVGRGIDRPVVLSTLASPDLARTVADARPAGLCIAGKTETENIGIEKLVRNCLATPEIRVLLLAGKDSAGHRPGQTLLALFREGVDTTMRVVGSEAPRPVLTNLTREEVARFRDQVSVDDRVGCEDPHQVLSRIEALRAQVSASDSSCGCISCDFPPQGVTVSPSAVSWAGEPAPASMDPAGYFLVLPDPARRILTVEHYDYENRLLHTVRGDSARALCALIVGRGWVSRLDHAAYLGRELACAEVSLQSGAPFLQDGA